VVTDPGTVTDPGLVFGPDAPIILDPVIDPQPGIGSGPVVGPVVPGPGAGTASVPEGSAPWWMLLSLFAGFGWVSSKSRKNRNAA
jgi:hypothetical protein